MTPSSPDVAAVIARLEKVERENRKLKRVGTIVLVAIAAFLLMAQARSSPIAKVLEAEKFIVRDKQKRVWIELGISDHGPRLTFFGKQGKESTTIQAGVLSIPGAEDTDSSSIYMFGGNIWMVGEGGTGLWILGKEGEINLGVKGEGSAELSIAGKEFNGGINLSVQPDGIANLRLSQKFLERVSLGLTADGSPGLAFWDKNLKARSWMNLQPNGAPQIVLADANAATRAWLMLQPDGSPVMAFRDTQGNVQRIPGEATEMSAGGRTWVLWGNTLGLSLPIGAWPTRIGCEDERIRRTQAASDKAAAEKKDASAFFTCLPDNVDPRQRR